MSFDIFHDPVRYGDMDSWRREALAFHDDGPVHLVETEGYRPFWVVIGNEAVRQVERQPGVFTNGPHPVLQPAWVLEQAEAQGQQIRTLIHMDPPDHTKYRNLATEWFKPSSLSRLQGRLDELSRDVVEQFETGGGELDFHIDVAMPYPLRVILSLLGLPESDYPRILKLTQEMFGAEDPDMKREGLAEEDNIQILMDFYEYFAKLTADRRANPRDDLASVIANGTVDGEPLPDIETMSYYTIVATAGHDTTSASLSEGMRYLSTHPDELAKLRDDPERLSNAVDEMIRLAAPVRHFMRHVQQDCEVAGQKMRAGDWLMLNYAAANLDPTVFDNPLEFDINRANADKHVAFGFGIHFCLGAQLARMEMRSVFGHLVPRLASVEPAGESSSIQATFVSGPKRLPIRYQLTDT